MVPRVIVLAAIVMPESMALRTGPLGATPRTSAVRMQYGYGAPPQQAGYGGGQYGGGQYGAPPQQAGYGAQPGYPQQGGYGAPQQMGGGMGGMASWRVCSANMITCYTVRNGEQQVLGRSDGPMPDTVSRQQCIITIGNDGTGTVTSMGRGPTGVRENYMTPWAWLQKDQRKVIADGTMISLDVNNPEGHVFTFFVLDDERPIRKRQRGDEKGELLIVESYSHTRTRTLMLSCSHTQTRTLKHAHCSLKLRALR